jgi:hypothetical protein
MRINVKQNMNSINTSIILIILSVLPACMFSSLALANVENNNKNHSQQEDTSAPNALYKNSVYLEFLGNGPIGAWNYERLITYSSSLFALRGGAGLAPIGTGSPRPQFDLGITTPISFSKLFAISSPHYIEIGAGSGLLLGGFNNDFKVRGQYIFFIVGYRLHFPITHEGTPFFLKVNYTPFYHFDFVDENTFNYSWIGPGSSYAWFGISMGLSF